MAENMVKMTIEIPESLHQAVKIAAAKKHTTVKALVVEGLRHVLKGGR
jgi:predicted HicB family RNase H-like nuclease